MPYSVEQIVGTLKAARGNKKLSQRALGGKVGVPQSHISKIESGAVDLRLSSLIELARVLDLEVVLTPRKLVPAVQSLIRSTAARDAEAHRRKAAGAAGSEAEGAAPAPVQPPGARPAYSLDGDGD
jgi:transcriptional regulator with XRE-family HTH domain